MLTDSWGNCRWCGRYGGNTGKCWCGHQMVYIQPGPWQRAGNGQWRLTDPGWTGPAHLVAASYRGYAEQRGEP